MRGMLKRRDQIHVSIQNDEQRMAKTRPFIHFVLLEEVDSRFLESILCVESTNWSRINAESVEAIMLAAPPFEQRIVGTAAIEITRESSS